jgi:hypothetical protein
VALETSAVSRNLDARPMFLGLEMEDFIVVMVAAISAMLIGQFTMPNKTIMGLPANWALMLGVCIVSIPGLMLLKYGKPQGYTSDLFAWYTKPKQYCCLERDSVQVTPYIKDDE